MSLLQNQQGSLEPLVLTLPDVGIDYTSATIVFSLRVVWFQSQHETTITNWIFTNRTATGATATAVLDGTEFEELGDVTCFPRMSIDGTFANGRSWREKVVSR